MNLSFKHPKIDTCNKCDTFKLQIDLAKTEESKQELIVQTNLHHTNAEKAYDSKRKDKSQCKSAPHCTKSSLLISTVFANTISSVRHSLS